MKINFEEILEKVKDSIESRNTLITDEHDVYYLTRIPSHSIKVMFIDDHWYLLTNKKYIDEAKRKVTWMEVIDYTDPNWLKNINVTNYFSEIHINDYTLTPKDMERIRKPFDDHSIDVIITRYDSFREVYLKDDLERMKDALKITENIIMSVAGQVKPGMTEREVERMIFGETAKTDAEGFAFPTNVTSGVNTASPVLLPGHKTILENELVTIGMGINYHGFVSDTALTFMPSGEPTPEIQKVHETLHKALKAVLKLLKPGAIPDELFEEYVKVLNKAKFDREQTVNSIGHPIGVELHNGDVYRPGNYTPIKAGELVNIEPGIFISGEFGIRIEQTYLITEDGYELVSKLPTDLKLS